MHVELDTRFASRSLDDVIEVEVDTKDYLRSFSTFYDKGVIMFFIGQFHTFSWIKKWLNTIVLPNCVEHGVIIFFRTLNYIVGKGLPPSLIKVGSCYVMVFDV